ncbi:MAG: POTRA domain-containing protein [Candidatus Krumholzibacteriota bacterium]|nr:POTRA domain-containing protein [Candidatus Krumholzibacteriota bacterium]
MFLRWKAALLSSFLLSAVFITDAGAEVIKRVTRRGFNIIGSEESIAPSFLKEGTEYSDSVVELEINRLDSLYFLHGRLAARISVDTLRKNSGIDIELEVKEGELTRVDEINISGDRSLLSGRKGGLDRLNKGDPFYPDVIQKMMSNTMYLYNNSGFPFAQVWMTLFRLDEEKNEVDISFSIVSGRKAVISEVVFEGLTRTDSSLVRMASRIDIPNVFSEEMIRRAKRNLERSGLFKSVGEGKIKKNREDVFILVMPVEEKKNSSFFQGALGFSRKDNSGDYKMNGRLDIQLDNIAGTGRKAGLSWFNDGIKYSETQIRYNEPFLFSTPAAVSFSIKQAVDDSLYNMHTGLFELKLPYGPWGVNSVIGISADRNIIPSGGNLKRSVRQSLRLGMEKTSGAIFRFDGRIEGGRKKNYPRDGAAKIDWQFIYSIDLSLTIPTIENQSLFSGVVSKGVFSRGDIHVAEMFPMGGARTLRGFRENQFRGERVSYVNLEYRLGGESRVFIFDDIGSYFRDPGGWKLKNGFGFGLRTSSDIGTVELSFGLAGKLSMDEARIHVSLLETF